MHTWYFMAVFTLLHFTVPMNTAAGIGINYQGSSELCMAFDRTVAQSLVTAIGAIDPNQLYNNGDIIVRTGGMKVEGQEVSVDAYLQHMVSSARGRDIQRLAHYITDHNCTVCGSVPFDFPSDNDVSKGELNFNVQYTSTNSTNSTTSTNSTASTTSTQATTTTTTNYTLSQLLLCQPCGTGTCTFTPTDNLPGMTFDLIVGSPVYNCDPHATAPNTDTITGMISLSDAWSFTESIGITFSELDILSAGIMSSWTQTRTTKHSQAIGITIAPGQIGALIAHVEYKRTQGTTNLGDGQSFPLISNQPLNVLGYDSVFVSCGSTLSANVSSSFNCTSSAPGRSWQGEGMFFMVSYVPVTLVIAILGGLVT